MKAIQIISQDVFDKIRSRFQNLEMGDETGAVTIDPAEARFFDFDFVNEGVNLGRVSISLNDLGSLKVYYSQGITENQDDPAKKLWYSFLKEMRLFAMRRLLRFDTRDIAKTNLDKNDFQHLAATQGPKEEPDMTNTMNESRWNNKSSKKTSRAVQGRTEVIVRHARPVDEMYPGSRSQRKNIKAIFIQNADGERFKYPFIHPAGAFAMAQHVDHGGIPHDPAGKAIIQMSEEIAQLQEFQRKVHRATLHDDATGITERAIGRLNELKARVDALGKRHHYENWMETFEADQDAGHLEMDEVTMEQYKQKFTQTSFEESLTDFFPLLHRIMSETNTVELEDYVQESLGGGMGYYVVDRFSKEPTDGPFNSPQEAQQANHNGGSIVQYPIDDVGTIRDGQPVTQRAPVAEFAEWAEAVEQGKLTDDQIEALKNGLSQLPQSNSGPTLELGPEGTTAVQFFQEFGLDDTDLQDKFKAAYELDPTSNAFVAFKNWANESYPELAVALGMSDTTPVEPQAEPAPEELPVAEGPEFGAYYAEQLAQKVFDENPNLPTNGRGDEYFDAAWPHMVADLGKKAASYKLNYDEDFPSDTISAYSWLQKNHGEEPTAETSAGVATVHGIMPAFENDDMEMNPGAMESADPKDMVKEVAKIVKSFYNRDNPEVGPFRGQENIALDVKKKCAEMFGEEAGEQACQMAEAFMEKLTNEWQQRHGQVANGHGDDGLARLKELLGNVKAKVEGISGTTTPTEKSPEMESILKLAGLAK